MTEKEYKMHLLSELDRVKKQRSNYKSEVDNLKKINIALKLIVLDKLDIKEIAKYLNVSLDELITSLNTEPYDSTFVNSFYFGCVIIASLYKRDTLAFINILQEYNISYVEVQIKLYSKYHSDNLANEILFKEASKIAISMYRKSLQGEAKELKL